MCPLPGSPLLLVRLQNPFVQDGVVLANAVWAVGCLLLTVVLPGLAAWQEAFSASNTYANYKDDDNDNDDNDNDSNDDYDDNDDHDNIDENDDNGNPQAYNSQR